MPKPVDTVTVADVDVEELVDNSLVKILNLSFGQEIEAEVWSRFEEKILGPHFEAKFGQDFRAEFWSKILGKSLVEFLRYSLVKILMLNFG